MVIFRDGVTPESTSRTGNLLTDAPGFSELLRGAYGMEGFRAIFALYQLLGSVGALSDAPILRAPDASFNPRPARLSQIILGAYPDSPLPLVGATVLSLHPKPCTVRTPIEGIKTEVALWMVGRACEVSEALQRHKTESSLSRESNIIIRAHLLDALRHLHMTSLTREARCQRVTEIATLTHGLPTLAGGELLERQLSQALARSKARFGLSEVG